MAKIVKDLRQPPYYDFTEDELKRGYTQLIALPGRTLPNRDLNSISGLIYGNMKKVTDLMIMDGSIVTGCGLFWDKEKFKLSLEAGKIYFGGLVIDVEPRVWLYTPANPLTNQIPTGKCVVCVEVFKEVIDERDDPSLADPVEYFENYNEPAAVRIKYKTIPRILLESEYEESTKINKSLIDIIAIESSYEFNIADIEIKGPTKDKPYISMMNNMLAQRTYDESGNFIAIGLLTTTEAFPDDSNYYNIRVSSGRCYVQGYQHNFNSETVKRTNGATDIGGTGSVLREQHTFLGLKKYRLNHKYIVNDNSIIIHGQVWRKEVPVESKVINVDLIDSVYYPITKVTKVWYGDTVYYQDEDGVKVDTGDLVIDGGQRIIWNNTRNKPPAGTTYLINIIQQQKFNKNVNYNISNDDDYNYYVEFINTDRTPIVIGSDFSIEYNWYLSRYDVVYVDDNGNIKIEKGIPGEDYEISIPTLPIYVLPLANIKVEPGKNPVSYAVTQFGIHRIPVSEMHSMRKRLSNVEFNLTLTQLEKEAQDKHLGKESSHSLSGIFTDGFVNTKKSDIYHPEYNCTIDIFKEECKLPLEYSIETHNDISFNNIPKNQEFLTLPYINNAVADWQRFVTDSNDVNPYKLVHRYPMIVVDPKYVVSFDDKVVSTRNEYLPAKLLYSRKTETVNTVVNPGASGNRLATIDVKETSTKETQTTTEKLGTLITELERIGLPYIKPTSVKITGKNFLMGSELEILVDNIRVNAQPVLSTGTTAGKMAGTIKVAPNGSFTALFTTPKNLTSGSKQVIARVWANYAIDPNFVPQKENTAINESYYDEANAIFEGYAYLRHFEQKIQMREIKTETTTVRRQVFQQIVNGDPVAQTFIFPVDTYITGIDLFFKSISNEDNAEVFFEIRDTLLGQPTDSALFQTTLDKALIRTSDNGTVATHIDFPEPIKLSATKYYSFVVGSGNVGFELWYSKMGNKDIVTNTLVESQPHQGVMLLSSNKNTWTPLQECDVTFVLYRCKFEKEYEYISKPFRSKIGHFSLLNSSIDMVKYDNTTLDIFYKINDGAWKTLIPDELYVVNYDRNSIPTLQLKIVMKTDNDSYSPRINLKNIEIITSRYKNRGSYVTKSVPIKF